jgi:hypothetical protein
MLLVVLLICVAYAANITQVGCCRFVARLRHPQHKLQYSLFVFTIEHHKITLSAVWTCFGRSKVTATPLDLQVRFSCGHAVAVCVAMQGSPRSRTADVPWSGLGPNNVKSTICQTKQKILQGLRCTLVQRRSYSPALPNRGWDSSGCIYSCKFCCAVLQ